MFDSDSVASKDYSAATDSNFVLVTSIWFIGMYSIDVCPTTQSKLKMTS